VADKTLRVRLEAITDQFSAKMKSAADETKRTSGSITQSARDNKAEWTQAGIAIGAAGAAIGLALRSAGQEAAEFESKLTKSSTLIGISTEEMQRMGQAALGLSETGQGPQALADALFFVQSAGMRGAEAMDVVEASAKAASIGLGDTATIADLVTSAVNAYGSETLTAAGATDTLIGAVREGKAEASELAGSMGRVLPIASQMGITFDEVGAGMAAMTRTGTNASEAATQLRAIMVSLLKPSDDASAALATYGLSAEGLRRTIKEDGLWAALMELKTAVGDNDAEIARIFPNIRALAGFLDLTGANAESTALVFENMADTTGLLAEGFETWSQTTEAAQMRFSASMEAAKISLGEGLAPAMKTTLDVGSQLAQAFTELPEGLRETIAVGGGVTAGFLTLAGAFLVLTPRILATKDAMVALNVTSSSFLKFMVNPYVLGIAAVVTALGFWAKAKADARQRVEDLSDAVRADSGVLGENTRARVENRLADEGAISAAALLGIAKSDLVDAAMGEGDALDRLYGKYLAAREATTLHGDAMVLNTEITSAQDAAWNDLQNSLGGLTPELEKAAAEVALVDQAQRNAEASAINLAVLYGMDVPRALDNTALSAEDLEGAFGGVEDAAADTRTEIEKLMDALDLLIGVNISAERAAIRLEEGWDKLTTELKGGADALDITTEKGRENSSMLLDQADNILAAMQAEYDRGASMTEIGRLYEDQVGQLKDVMRQAGLTEDQIDEYITTLGLTPEEVITAIIANADQAITTIDRVTQMLGRIPTLTTTTIRTREEMVRAPGSYGHDGGLVTTSGIIPRFHDGGMVGGSSGGLKSDEVPAILQTGEVVLSRSQVSMMAGVFSGLPKFHDGGTVSEQPASPSGDVWLVLEDGAKLKAYVQNATGMGGVRHLDRAR
jgi:TP901 family phage tail tape measure protein